MRMCALHAVALCTHAIIDLLCSYILAYDVHAGDRKLDASDICASCNQAFDTDNKLYILSDQARGSTQFVHTHCAKFAFENELKPIIRDALMRAKNKKDLATQRLKRSIDQISGSQ